ncbi:uncharacterized protein LAESUDRAFT_712312 [Laetiporus sulphureus 93-53]|uniref:Uncharacterized protein n=1 Tax=Laetiporus sulphureus 93-53 TaxID=1314785 RepID=A0A165FMD4_9APHY|nr:uncharacterized protein LAESUDRAFT_712312 [Laetiporus sulphureus 93-53]KZT09188.1 hypothetical protein LAESUDRAFT_712312 [Laetiporus sulphureus 93-53]
MTAKYHLTIVNYPLKKFCCPSDVGSKTELELLLRAWESGAMYWKYLSNEEFEQWQTARFNAKMTEMHGDDNDNDIDNVDTCMVQTRNYIHNPSVMSMNLSTTNEAAITIATAVTATPALITTAPVTIAPVAAALITATSIAAAPITTASITADHTASAPTGLNK